MKLDMHRMRKALAAHLLSTGSIRYRGMKPHCTRKGGLMQRPSEPRSASAQNSQVLPNHFVLRFFFAGSDAPGTLKVIEVHFAMSPKGLSIGSMAADPSASPPSPSPAASPPSSSSPLPRFLPLPFLPFFASLLILKALPFLPLVFVSSSASLA